MLFRKPFAVPPERRVEYVGKVAREETALRVFRLSSRADRA